MLGCTFALALPNGHSFSPTSGSGVGHLDQRLACKASGTNRHEVIVSQLLVSTLIHSEEDDGNSAVRSVDGARPPTRPRCLRHPEEQSAAQTPAASGKGDSRFDTSETLIEEPEFIRTAVSY